MSDDESASWLAEHQSQLRMAGAVATVGLLFLALVVFAASGWGLFGAVAFVGGAILGLSGPPLAILLFRDGLPLNGLIGTGLVICAQVAFGRSVLVRRDDGTYEWTVLRGDWAGPYCELSDGRQVPVNGERGELFSFGFGQLAVTEDKTDRNMDEWTTPDTPGASNQPVEHRAGMPIVPPKREGNGWLVTHAAIQRVIRGSASSHLIRRGRDKALDEEGGTQQVSQLWVMGFASALLVGGFILGYGALIL